MKSCLNLQSFLIFVQSHSRPSTCKSYEGERSGTEGRSTEVLGERALASRSTDLGELEFREGTIADEYLYR